MNATINILCFKSKTLANGEHPLMICICKDSKRKYISLGVSVAPQYWDFQKNKPKRNCPNRIMIEKLIAQKSRELSELVLELEADSKNYTATTLVEKAVKPKIKTTVGSLMKEHIKELRDANRTGYALSMEQVYNSLIKFNGHLDMPFSDIDIQWLKKYEQWLRNRGLAENTNIRRNSITGGRHKRILYLPPASVMKSCVILLRTGMCRYCDIFLPVSGVHLAIPACLVCLDSAVSQGRQKPCARMQSPFCL